MTANAHTPTDFFDRLVAESGLASTGTPSDVEVVRSLIDSRYGLSGTLSRIATEKDDTFRLTTAAGTYLVKVSPDGEDPDIVALQTAAIRHVSTVAPDLPVQQVIPTLDGCGHHTIDATTGKYPRILRVLQFIPGTTLSHADPSHEQLQNVGGMLARLSLALKDFTHGADTRLVLWDLAHFHRLGPLRAYTTDPSHLDVTDRVIAGYNETVTPVVAALDTQVIHGDFSPFNVVVSPSDPRYVTGILDFGDAVRSATIFDVSVAMANQLSAELPDPWDRAAAVLSGYQRVRTLSSNEMSLLPHTVLARLLMRALIAGWRAHQNPERHEYLMSHASSDWENLAAAAAVSPDEVAARLQAPPSRF
ncbi:hypothetical protein A5784_36105 [Mycobacterium sp. 852013-50091_SCH5140682]|uniref:phosphotransferase n=1 Tax=Mycobacterium sp. 852013-50091_SCH5140682 TaxID=1834109 RepID=UPI0007EB04DC|nr:phosphotransferase [Mycobacterium sp. 852013-50091_SCH5140682]OBC10927.1 hypothetical protein A5784_36105 [Mycobacterium sp. 852013-50091_SCH5140682]